MSHISRRELLVNTGKSSLLPWAAPLSAQLTVADLIFQNGRITTLNGAGQASAVAIVKNRFLAVGNDADMQRHRGPKTQVIDLAKRTVVPGLNDSHMHVIRTATTYNQDLRWDGVPSLADALRMVKLQAARTPQPQWVRVDGGWSPYQFRERRLPTVDELNTAAPDTPVFVLLYYKTAILNRAALRALGYTKATPNPPGGEIQRDGSGNPTGVLFAKPFPALILSPLGKAPTLSVNDQKNSALHFMYELNRFGITSVIDPGSVGVAYPHDYDVISALAKDGKLTVRLAMYLLPQESGQELKDFEMWFPKVPVEKDDDWFRFQGGGEILLNEAMDWDVYTQPLVTIPPRMEADMLPVIQNLIQHRWSFRHHATYNGTITRLLNVLEKANTTTPLDKLRWTIDHAEFLSQHNIERIARLGGGVAVQHRFAFHGEYAVQTLGAEKLRNSPPLKELIKSGIPLGAGTDSTRDSSYNPWVCLKWLVTGKTVGGMKLAAPENRLDRTVALRMYTQGSAWFSGEEDKKGTIAAGKLADLAVLSADYFSVPENRIDAIESVLTVVGGKIVYASEQFQKLSPKIAAVSPAWSPVGASYNGYYRAGTKGA